MIFKDYEKNPILNADGYTLINKAQHDIAVDVQS